MSIRQRNSVYNIHCTYKSIQQCTLVPLCCTVYSVYCTVYSVHCSVYTDYATLITTCALIWHDLDLS